MDQLTAIVERIQSQPGFVITGHYSPDGDCIGSILGLAHGLQRLGKEVQMVLTDPVPEVYRYLPDSEKIESATTFQARFSDVIYLDCATEDRCGESLALLLRSTGRYFINIDHHVNNPGYADLNWVEGEAAATAILIHRLLCWLGVKIDAVMAEPICIGIIQDTGYFRHSNTSPEILRLVAELQEQGANLHAIYLRLFESKSVAELKLLSLAMGSLEVCSENRIAYMQLRAADVERLGAKDIFPEDIVNQCMLAKSVEIGLLFREVASDHIKVSFRSKHEVDVAQIAGTLGGGGHRKAAGVTIRQEFSTVLEMVLMAVREVIEA